MNVFQSLRPINAALLLAAALCLPVQAEAQTTSAPAPSATTNSAPQTPARRLMGEVAPKLAELTDTVPSFPAAIAALSR